MTKKPFKLTVLRADILRLCATQDERGYVGVAPYFQRHFKVGSHRALLLLRDTGYVTFDPYGWAVATNAGLAALDAYDRGFEEGL